MAQLNKAEIIGNLAFTPELRFTSAGNPVCNLRIATNRTYNSGEERKKETTWHSVVVWGKQAEACAEYLQKGREVYVEGRIQQRQYMDKEGNKRFAYEIVANNVQFLGRPRSAQNESVPEGHETEDTPDFSDDDLPY